MSTNRSSSKEMFQIWFHMATCHVGFLLILGLDSTLTDACLEPKDFKREPLNVIRIMLPENCLAIPFNFPSCQVFPEAIKPLYLHGCLLAWEPLSFPTDIIPEPIVWEGLPNVWQHSRVNSETPIGSEQEPWKRLEKDPTWRQETLSCETVSFMQILHLTFWISFFHRHNFSVEVISFIKSLNLISQLTPILTINLRGIPGIVFDI